MFILSFIFVIVCDLLNGNESDIFFFIVLLYVSLISFVYTLYVSGLSNVTCKGLFCVE